MTNKIDSAPFIFAYSKEGVNATDADYKKFFDNMEDTNTEDAAVSLTYAATAAVATFAFLLH